MAMAIERETSAIESIGHINLTSTWGRERAKTRRWAGGNVDYEGKAETGKNS